MNDPVLQATFAPLQKGHAIAGTALDRSLLLLSDIPGVAINATLQPDDAVEMSDLAVAATSGAALTDTVALNNYGNRCTEDARINGTVNFINLCTAAMY